MIDRIAKMDSTCGRFAKEKAASEEAAWCDFKNLNYSRVAKCLMVRHI